MIVRLLLVAATLAVPVAHGFETRLSAGLAVTVDRVQEPIEVDGVAMVVHHVSGTGVPELARRIEAMWRSEGSVVTVLQQGAWVLRSRMVGATSEVVQWQSGTAPELLWSSLDAKRLLRKVPDPGVTLPAGCAWGRSIAGHSGDHRYLQRTARCTLAMHELASALRRSLPSQGWHVLNASDQGLLLERRGNQGLLSFATHEGDSTTWLTWLRVQVPQ